jgi:hypothetical protein
MLDLKVEELIDRMCGVHNGGKITIDPTVAAHAGLQLHREQYVTIQKQEN